VSTASPEVTVVAGDGTCAKLNLNEATGEQFTATIPGFSSRMVREFLEYRPYVSIQQFRREIGKYVDASQVAEYEKYVYVPVDPNASDAETLKQLPGVDDALAETIISSRPYTTGEAFGQILATHLDEQQLMQLSCYLAAQP
jgi:DNA uptake protein ComE-like DNA-binding protein